VGSKRSRLTARRIHDHFRVRLWVAGFFVQISGLMRTVSAWRCKCGTRIKVVGESDRTTPANTDVVFSVGVNVRNLLKPHHSYHARA
jgi:hypothetical protein